MQTLQADSLTAFEVDKLEEVTRDLPQAGALKEFLEGLIGAVRGGEDVKMVASSHPMTPAMAAKLLGVSRVHVYKLMDRGEIEFRRVGNDRRTTLAAVTAFQKKQDEARRAFALRAAHPRAAREDALNSL